MPVMNQDITGVRNTESSRPGDGGRVERTIVTTFKVRGQGPFSIELPKDGWTMDAADKAMQEIASQIVNLCDRYPGS